MFISRVYVVNILNVIKTTLLQGYKLIPFVACPSDWPRPQEPYEGETEKLEKSVLRGDTVDFQRAL